MPIKVQETYRTTLRLGQKRKSHIIIKTLNRLKKDRILKATREKNKVTNKGRSIRIIPDFSAKTLKARKTWRDALQITYGSPDSYTQENFQLA